MHVFGPKMLLEMDKMNTFFEQDGVNIFSRGTNNPRREKYSVGSRIGNKWEQ